jgi:hypothetical protein
MIKLVAGLLPVKAETRQVDASSKFFSTKIYTDLILAEVKNRILFSFYREQFNLKSQHGASRDGKIIVNAITKLVGNV